ncbi:MAG: DUF3429 domain-containing protein [Woeseiaceae bacterium]|nr:DUF3429 domain-containing protein [Woeseiaceae bacterium]
MPRLSRILALAGALPFVAGAFMAMAGLDTPVPAALLTSSYGLAIVSFLCGVHWGTFLYRADAAPVNLFVSSNAVVVGTWLAWLLAPLGVVLGAQVFAFLALLFIDQRLLAAGLLTQHYFVTRVEATALAVLSIATVWFVIAV